MCFKVQWCMEVICFGLSLPLAEHEAIKDCVNIYCEWLTALLPHPKICVPQPILDDPNIYSRKIISHLHYLFIPRKGEGTYLLSSIYYVFFYIGMLSTFFIRDLERIKN